MIETSLELAERDYESLPDGQSLIKIVAAGRKVVDGKGGYFLIIGDNLTQYRWAVTENELVMLRDLLNQDFPADQFLS